MKENEYNRIWQNAPGRAGVKADKKVLLAELGQQVKTFDRAIRNRDMREIGVAAALMPILALQAIYIPFMMSKIALAMMIPWCLIVIITLLRVKRYKPDDLSLPLAEYLEKHRLYLQKERMLLKNVLYWYILPPAVLCMLFFIGFGMNPARLVVFTLPVLFIGWFIYNLNKKTVKEDFDPLIRNVQSTIDELKRI